MSENKKNTTVKDKKTEKKTSASAKKTPVSTKKNDKSQKAVKTSKTKDEKPKKTTKPKKESKPKKDGDFLGLKRLGGLIFAKMIRGGADELRANSEKVNQLNVFPVPDGDTGDNMSLTLDSGVAAIENLETDDIAEVMKFFSRGMLMGARGNSGVILSQFFAGIAKGFEEGKDADPEVFGRALQMGVEQAYATVMTPTEGTILTVAREAVEYAISRITPKSTVASLFKDLATEMYASVDRTPEILPVLKEAGVVDSGGAGLFYIIDGFSRVLNGEEIVRVGGRDVVHAKAPVSNSNFNVDSEMTYGYCTELLVQLLRSKGDPDRFDIEELRAYLATLGDSIVAFKTDSIVKIHVHTFTPWRVLEKMGEHGAFLTVKIENMSVQHTELENGAVSEEKPAEKPAERKQYGVVAVASGDGLEAVFREFGADVVVRGGQTKNPSAGEFLDAFKAINAEHIFVFPNNSNIMMAAEQAAGIYEDAKIHVIPSKLMGTGYVAISTLALDNPDPEEVVRLATETINSVSCGYISPSIRDADMNGIHIENGDTIGIIGKEIVTSHADRMEAAKSLLRILFAEEKYFLTVIRGTEATDEESEILTGFLKEAFPQTEVYFIDGGQEVYPFIFVAE